MLQKLCSEVHVILFQVQFEVIYRNDREPARSIVYVVLGVLCVLVFVWSMFQAFSWWRRAGRVIFDLTIIFKFLLIFIGCLGEAVFVVLFCASLWWFFCFKVRSLLIWFIQ